MTQLYIVEIKKNIAGEYEHQVYWVWDEDADTAQLKAESKYHEILSAAAVSNNLTHAAILFSAEGFPVMHQCYKHPNAQPTPEPEETITEDE